MKKEVPWRKAAKQAMKEASENREDSGKESFNYRWEHVQAVVTTAVALAKQTNGDVEIVEAAAWLHDIRKETREQHPVEGAKIARQLLPNTDFPAEKIAAVALAIEEHMGLWRDVPLENLESQILWDADKLTKIGLTAVFHWTSNRIQKEKQFTTFDMIENGRAAEWIPKTVASMHTKPAQRAAKKRYAAFLKVWEQLEAELAGEDLGG